MNIDCTPLRKIYALCLRVTPNWSKHSLDAKLESGRLIRNCRELSYLYEKCKRDKSEPN